MTQPARHDWHCSTVQCTTDHSRWTCAMALMATVSARQLSAMHRNDRRCDVLYNVIPRLPHWERRPFARYYYHGGILSPLHILCDIFMVNTSRIQKWNLHFRQLSREPGNQNKVHVKNSVQLRYHHQKNNWWYVWTKQRWQFRKLTCYGLDCRNFALSSTKHGEARKPESRASPMHYKTVRMQAQDMPPSRSSSFLVSAGKCRTSHLKQATTTSSQSPPLPRLHPPQILIHLTRRYITSTADTASWNNRTYKTYIHSKPNIWK